MKSLSRLYFFMPVMILIIACGGQSKTDAEVQSEVTSTSMPRLSDEVVKKLFNQTRKVDILFFDLPISVSQDEEPAAKNTAAYVLPISPRIGVQCPAVARVSWIGDEDILWDADVHVGEGCAYFTFVQNNNPVAVNAMAEQGVQFFLNIMKQAKEQMPK